jgi:NTE family protein
VSGAGDGERDHDREARDTEIDLDDDDLPGPGLQGPRVHRSAIPPAPAPAMHSLSTSAKVSGVPRRTAFVLSGGGARGAYEVGVLSYVFGDLVRLRGGRFPSIDILCGTSVGAINACYLAAHAGDPALGIRRLMKLWHDLELPEVLGFGVRQALGLPRLILGGGTNAAGLFDVRPMADLIEREIGWRSLQRNLRRGNIRALSISTTEVSTGRTVIWMQTAPDVALPTTAPPRTLIRADAIGTQHALASAAIPLLFPPVKLGGEFYCDGGLRLNTPMAPALRLGATHVFSVALSRELQGIVTPETGPGHRALGAAALLGKVLNAFLLDHVVNDLDVLARINAIMNDGVSAFGPEFLPKLSAAARARGGETYRPVQCLAIKPTQDIGRLAADHVMHGRMRGNPILAKQLLKALYVGGDTDADLASYLLFDGDFARKLIDLGRADAEARREEILQFFADDAGTDPRHAAESASG